MKGRAGSIAPDESSSTLVAAASADDSSMDGDETT